MPSSWRSLIDASYRKVEIAAFHCEQLAYAAAANPPPYDGRPDIPTQAFFEGVILAAISAIDQVAQAANIALGLRLKPGDLFEGAAAEIEKLVPEFKTWRDKPIGRDLRRLRVRMVHYSYNKEANPGPRWEVEVAYQDYVGSRELLEYSRAALSYARELAGIANELQRSLEKRA